LRSLGVEAIVLEGGVEIGRYRVLGKGCASVVVKAIARGREVALKVRRTDSDRDSLEREAEILSIANSIGVGPKLLGYTRDILVMECVEGVPLSDWLESVEEPEEIKRLLRKLLIELFEMDEKGICHKELSRPGDHVLVDKRGEPVVLDFETASLESKKSNLTQVLGYLFFGRSGHCEKLRSLLRVDVDRLRELLREYKRDKSIEKFQEVMRCIGLSNGAAGI